MEFRYDAFGIVCANEVEGVENIVKYMVESVGQG